MLALLELYQWTLLAGFISAPALALLGIQLATRDRSMQTLCVGQGAMVGVLCGIGLLHHHEGTLLGSMGPFASAIALSALTFLATDLLVVKKVASKNTIFAFIFAFLLSAGYLVSSLFPALESHMAQVYFGDLATLAERDSKIASIASLVSLILILAWHKAISNQSFELAVFGSELDSSRGRGRFLVFKIVTLVMLCFSVQFVGFLFTVSMLFIPTAMASYMKARGLTLHAVTCAALAAVSTLIGFLLSLQYTRLPTVPAIVAVMFVLALGILIVDRVAYAIRGVRGDFVHGRLSGSEVAAK